MNLNGTKSSILIVDDEPAMRDVLGRLLAAEGYDLAFASNGAEALTRAVELTPDLILLDVMMPDMDGFDVCRRLRADPLLAEVPVIMVTALDDHGSRLGGIEAGADEFVSKPFDDVELLARVRTVIRLNRYRWLLLERAKFERVVELSPNGIMIVDAEGTICLTNPAILRMLGAESEASVVGQKLMPFVAPEQREGFCAFLDGIVADASRVAQVEATFVRSHNEYFHTQVDAGHFVWNSLPAVQIVVHDITERKRAEEALRESEERYRSLFERIPVGLFQSTPDGRILDANPAHVQLLGCPDRETLLATPVTDFYMAPEERERWKALTEREGGTRDWEIQWRRRDGMPIWVRESAQAVRDAEGNVLYYEGVAEDITEHKRMEQLMRRTRRLAAMGHMAAALAHEIKNPLQAIQGHLELVLEFDLERGEREEYLRFCSQEIAHLTEITERVLSFARPVGDGLCPASIVRLMERALALVNKPLQHADVQMTTDLPTDLPSVLVVPDQIVQVLLNLMINAIEAMPDGGRVHVQARVDGERVVLSLTNDGPPIPVEHMDHIFDPFFTTKPDGTGLGLFISHNIVEQHGGTISVENLKGGRGVAFTVMLPIVPAAEQQEAVEGAVP